MEITYKQWSRRRTVQAVLAALAVLLAFFLSFYNFGQDGYSNLYYSAAVKSMTTSWHNFFFLSFDPAGFVTVDKPPVALWVEAAFVKAFGFHSWTLLLPEALEAAGCVFVLYHLVKKAFGFLAGWTAAIFLAVTPIFIAAARSNNPDAMLGLILLLAVWMMARAAETGRIRYLFFTAVFVGIGFNTKMLVAFLVLPACGLVYLFMRGAGWKRKVLYAALAMLVLVGVSASWVEAVDRTPAINRPYVGSSANDTETNLVFGYNGLNRVFSQKTPSAHRAETARCVRITAAVRAARKGTSVERAVKTASRNQNAAAQDGPGIARMFDWYVGEQISWFLPLAIVGTIAAILYVRSLKEEERYGKINALLLWGGWALVMALFFSFYGELTHRYYLNILAPGFAALAGIGFSCMVRLAVQKGNGWKSGLLSVGLVASVLFQLTLLQHYPAWYRVLLPLEIVCAALAVALPMVRHVSLRRVPLRLGYGMAGVALACLLAAPFLWSLTTVLGSISGSDASAGPDLLSDGGSTFPSATYMVQHLKGETADPVESKYDSDLAIYLEAHQDGAEFLAAVPTAPLAEQLIIDTGKPVMTIGGYNGTNPILPTHTFRTMVAEGKVRYFLDTTIPVYVPDTQDRQSVRSNAVGDSLNIHNTMHKTQAPATSGSRFNGVRSGNPNLPTYAWAVEDSSIIHPGAYLGKSRSGASYATLYQLSRAGSDIVKN